MVRHAVVVCAMFIVAAFLASPAHADSKTSTSSYVPPSFPAKPNIVWVMADDLGWGEVGVFPCTSPHGRIATPNLDKFAAEGMMFTQAYAGYTVCAPSRTALFTGRHSGQYYKHGLNGEELTLSQTASRNTTAQLLQRAGYTTAAFGKTAPLTNPVQQGFGTFLGQVDQAACHNMYPELIDQGSSTRNFNLSLNWKPKNRDLCMANPQLYNYTVDITHNYGKQWLADHVQQSPDKPFFLYMSYTVPHAGGWSNYPLDLEQGAPVPSDGQYANETSWPDVERDHAAVITYLDNYIGDLMAQIKSLGIDNNTIVFFASDNGAHLEGGHSYKFFNSTGGLLGHKRSLFEGGMRSPSLVRWPGVVPAGAVSDFQWAFWDVLPTFMELAGEPSLTPDGIDGLSIVPTLTQAGVQKQHEYVYFTWRGTGVPPLESEAAPHALPDSPAGAAAHATLADVTAPSASGYAVRMQNWKGVVPHCADTKGLQPSMEDPLQLYDLSSDPFETTDIASSHPNEVKLLLQTVIAADISCRCYQC